MRVNRALRMAYDGVIDFVFGDDWIMALGVLVVLVLAYAIGRVTSSWWVIVLGIPLVLATSLYRAVRTKA